MTSTLSFPGQDTLTKCLLNQVNRDFSRKQLCKEQEIREKVAEVAGKEFANKYSFPGCVQLSAAHVMDDLVNGSGIGRLFPGVPFVNPKAGLSFVESVEWVRFVERALINCSKP